MTTDINLFLTMLAHKRQLQRREGIERIKDKCQADVENVLRGIPNISFNVAPVVENNTPSDVLSGWLGIDMIEISPKEHR